MAEIEIPEKMVRKTKMCIGGLRKRVLSGDMLSYPFETNSRLKQRDSITLYYNYYIQHCPCKSDKNCWNKRLTLWMFLTFVGDIDVAINSIPTTKEVFKKIEAQRQKIGLRIKPSKNKQMETNVFMH